MSIESRTIDVAIVGGGLHGSLVALALARWRPEARVLLIEACDRFGGGPIAPFRLRDVGTAMSLVIEPLIVGEWPRYYVELGDETHSVADALGLIDPAQLHAEVCAHLGSARCWRNVSAIPRGDQIIATPRGEIRAGLVLDLRPPPPTAGPAILATMIDYRSPDPLGLRYPILLDSVLAGRTGAAVWQYFPIGRHGVMARALRFDATPLTLPVRFAVTTLRAPREIALSFAADPRWSSLPPHPLLPSAMGSAAALAQAVIALPEWTPTAYAAARTRAAAKIAPAVAARAALFATLRDDPDRRCTVLAEMAMDMTV